MPRYLKNSSVLVAGLVALCAAFCLVGCEVPGSTTAYSVQLLDPRPGVTTGLAPTLVWRIVDYTPGETYHVLIRTDLGTDPLDEYYADEFDTGWHSEQTQQARIVLSRARYRHAKVWWSVRVWDSKGTEYVCRDVNWWFNVTTDDSPPSGACTSCGIVSLRAE